MKHEQSLLLILTELTYVVVGPSLKAHEQFLELLPSEAGQRQEALTWKAGLQTLGTTVVNSLSERQHL